MIERMIRLIANTEERDDTAEDQLRRLLDRAGAQPQGEAPACVVAGCVAPDRVPFAGVPFATARAVGFAVLIAASLGGQVCSHNRGVLRQMGVLCDGHITIGRERDCQSSGRASCNPDPRRRPPLVLSSPRPIGLNFATSQEITYE